MPWAAASNKGSTGAFATENEHTGSFSWRVDPPKPLRVLFCCSLVSRDVEFADDDDYDDSDDDGDFAVAGRAVGAGGEPEVMGKSSTEQETDNRQGAVRIPFTGEDKLAERAAAEEHTGETDQQHAQRIPQSVHMSDRLPLKGEGKIGAGSCG